MDHPLLRLTGTAVIAHRGGAALRPENTIAAFDHAASLGVDGFELDVHTSRDGEPVVIHDPMLERTTNGTGPVSARSAAELAGLDAAWAFGPAEGFPSRGRGFGVPRLADVLDRYREMPIVVEVKGDDPRTAARAVAVIREAGAEGRVMVAGFSQVVVDAARRLAPDVPTSASRPESRAAIRRARFWLPLSTPAFRAFLVPFRHIGLPQFGRRFVRTALQAGLPVHAWTINDPGDMRLLVGWGVTGIVTDRPDIAIKQVGVNSPHVEDGNAIQ
jgi:glycerophosphoryl diester phosphodiesterase